MPTVWVVIHDEGSFDSYPSLIGVFSTRERAEQRAASKEGSASYPVQHTLLGDDRFGCCRVEELEVDA